MWEKQINVNAVCEIRGKSTVYLGAGAIRKIGDICSVLKKERQISRVIVITGKNSYIKSGAWSYVARAFEQSGFDYTMYSEITPNPTVDQVDEATDIARLYGAQAVVTIGGGSPIDAAKCVAILKEYPARNARELLENKFLPNKALPLVAINLTHGTGTEADRFAVVSIPEKEAKPVLACDCIYPLYSIDDPALMTSLSPEQTAYVSIDALNHAIEASTTVTATPFSILLAKETIRLVAQYLPVALNNPQDLTARYYLLYASLLAGISFDNGLLHYTHALEHPLSGVRPEIAHGLGLAMILPAVIKQIYPASKHILADILSPILCGLKGEPDEADIVCEGLRKWLFEVGVKPGLGNIGFVLTDIEKLTNLAFNTPSLKMLLDLGPLEASHASVSNIYMDSF